MRNNCKFHDIIKITIYLCEDFRNPLPVLHELRSAKILNV